MDRSFFDQPIDRRRSASLKWGKYRNRQIIPMWVADMDFQSPPAVIDALHRRTAHGVFGYSTVPESLSDTVVWWLKHRYGWSIEPGWLVWLPGLVSGLNIACRAIGRPGDAVMTATPIYPPFLTAPGLSGRTLQTVALTQAPGGQWCLDMEHFEQAVTDRTRLFLLCNPHNPVGKMFSYQELESIRAVCERHDIIVCADEIHCDLVLHPDRRHVPYGSLDPAAGRSITLMAPSKTFNLPGLGCAFAVIPDARLRSDVKQAMAGIVPGINCLGTVAAEAAYRGGGPWLQALIDYLRSNRDRVRDAVDRMPGIEMGPVDATYLAWLDARGADIDDAVAFFEHAGVGLQDGKDFAAPGFLRLNFGCPESLLIDALAKMRSALSRR